MEKRNTVFIGCDLGDRFSEVCVLDGAGAVVDQSRVCTTQRGLRSYMARFDRACVVVEAGVHSRWVADLVEGLGHRVVVANPRQVRLIWQRRTKTDRSDALLLARLGRADLQLLAPVQHRSRGKQVDLTALRSRDILIGARTKLVNHVRGTLKPFGLRVEDCRTEAFPDRAEGTIPPELLAALAPVLAAIRTINEQIAQHDRQIEQTAATVYGETTRRLTQVDGIGTITALAFQLTLDDPKRFRKSRFVGGFLGLVPAKDQSGDLDPQRHITKTGDAFVRRLLVQCAQYLLGPFGSDSDLRRWGLRLAERGGKNAKKRAVIAVARKLAVLLHRLWLSGERYQPIGYASRALTRLEANP
ncbi:MAG TPA: IS110 family transposase [Anaeromyxobacteraceae bacterium]|nr:IS110 family transposase [Anaeromyxobacteraceae bacterium]